MRPAIVVGSAPCYREDLDAASKRYPDAFVMTVNGACVAVEEADAMMVGHLENVERYEEARANEFPDKPIELWAKCNTQHLKQYKAGHPGVTHWFGLDVASGATSAAIAVRMLLQVGYEPVVMCGCPLDNSGYFEGEDYKISVRHDCRRVGAPEEDSHRTIRNYRDKFERLAKGRFEGRVFSMSGLTRKLLGPPPGVA